MYLVAVFVLCILIFVHELGHFLLAKWNNVGVLAFSIGFGPILWKKQVGETTYSLRIFPLGGFVRMAGDDPRALDPSYSPEESESKPGIEKLDPNEFTEQQRAIIKDRNKWFLLKGFWAKFMIVFAGPGFNFIFAILLAIITVYIYGAAEPVDKPFIGDVVPNHPAEKAGLKAGDLVKSINGKEILTWSELSDTVRKSGGQKMAILIDRQESESATLETLNIEVVAEEDRSGLVNEKERETGDFYRIGIAPKFTKIQVSFAEAATTGTFYVWSLTKQTVIGIKGLILGHISADNIAGPVRIFEEAGRSAKKGLDALFGFMIFLSISLAVLNLIPIPVLDGGHILFFIIEAVKGSPISLRVREVANQVGFVLLVGLMLFAISNDLFR